jgi:hypothetical protein
MLCIGMNYTRLCLVSEGGSPPMNQYGSVKACRDVTCNVPTTVSSNVSTTVSSIFTALTELYSPMNYITMLCMVTRETGFLICAYPSSIDNTPKLFVRNPTSEALNFHKSRIIAIFNRTIAIIRDL